MIESVKKAVDILSCFTQDEPVLGNSEIAEKLGLSRSTTHHLVSTLSNKGVLMRDSNRKYRLGWKLLEWNNNVMFQKDIYNKALPLVKGLVQRFQGTVHIGMFDKGDVIFVLKVSSADSLEISTYLGARKPAYSTSTGKVLLSSNPAYLEETISRGLLSQAPNTITDINLLKKDLEIVRKNGYSISNNENDTGTYAIAAPILSYSGQTIAAVNLVGPIAYMQGSERNNMIQCVVNTAKEISQELGYIEL